MSAFKSSPRIIVGELTKTSLVAALYVTVTLMLSVISFGAVQLRLSEMFNYLALYNKRYVLAVTLGVVIANFMSPTWLLDVPIGGIGTLLVLLLCRRLTRNIQNQLVKNGNNSNYFYDFYVYGCWTINFVGRASVLANLCNGRHRRVVFNDCRWSDYSFAF